MLSESAQFAVGEICAFSYIRKLLVKFVLFYCMCLMLSAMISLGINIIKFKECFHNRNSCCNITGTLLQWHIMKYPFGTASYWQVSLYVKQRSVLFWDDMNAQVRKYTAKFFFYYLRFYLRCLTDYDSVYIEVGNEA